MKNLNNFITGTDWKILQEQKGTLSEIVNKGEIGYITIGQKDYASFEGILSLLDSLQDSVVADGLYPEHHVFLNLEKFNELEKQWGVLDTSNEDSLVASASPAIEPVCDSTVQVQSTILIPGKKYKCLSLTEEDAFLESFKKGELKDLIFIKEANILYFSSEICDNIGLLPGATFKEIKEEPTEVNILGEIDTDAQEHISDEEAKDLTANPRISYNLERNVMTYEFPSVQPPTIMYDFYFTFGQGHFTVDGEKMSDSWVRVTGPDEMSARAYFAQFFATPVMGKADKWAFSYSEGNFKKEFFPAGEYEHFVMPTEEAIKNYSKEVRKILNRKQMGIDCEEHESGYIKQWVKHTTPMPGSGEQQILEDIQVCFPNEYGEAIEKMEDALPEAPNGNLGYLLKFKPKEDATPAEPTNEDKIKALYAEKTALLDKYGVFGGGPAVNAMHDKINKQLEALGIAE